ncbi:MAG: nucleotidyl transferase AbiEii/AbiGii toxin family protein [Betaproteobacteria bacterium]|nr:nucleotidyl transferase AbiEii/AbiGii toxin family protein [Rhodocyclaceae bacterium]MCA3135666.1 nucleotidyl transferase AbiEii/AbiGii toxin family protein [Rhodocyclaceae bacterium]MCA3141279.1 nucleotidyl transferase AbiEii/AbiGii toxin family protein [Rhodocyclaceae bacterium]MCA3145180.1 nucleotidyl transferase AbiEii/AbiGii toxin family protein [Rhodocyclaceae bacterium]MCE2897319.1 nucleotidyl transferase AbiEii/AbiGii toxin family protein [Betaproteobacteria bacterium]
MTGRNVGASVRARLLARARETRQDFSLVLTRYAIERLLYRIGVSSHADHFLLKGALLFDLWFDVPHRPTRDIDLLGFGSGELSLMESTFKEISAIAEDDGVTFDPDTVRATEIRKDANYAGVRVGLLGSIDGARCQIQVDIGFGDAVTPDPDDVEYPVMLPEFAAPKLRAYPRYTVVAEKLEALTSLGMANSRMKDYFDLWVLARYADFDADILRRAVRATFDRRATSMSGSAPLGLTDAFAQDAQKDAQWLAFLRRNRLEGLALNDVIAALGRFLLPVVEAAASNSRLRGRWTAGGPWSQEESA